MKHSFLKRLTLLLSGFLATFLIASTITFNGSFDSASAAGSVTANRIAIYLKDYHNITSGTDPIIHLWNIGFTSDSGYTSISQIDTSDFGNGMTIDSGGVYIDVTMNWDGDGYSRRNWKLELPWYINKISYGYKLGSGSTWYDSNYKDGNPLTMGSSGNYIDDFMNSEGGTGKWSPGTAVSGSSYSVTTYTLSYSVKPASPFAGGTITSTPNISSGSDVKAKTRVTLSASANANFTWSKWTYLNNITGVTATDSTITFKMIGAASPVANFNGAKVTVSFDKNGGDTKPNNKDVTYGSTYGTLTPATWKGHTFDGWYTAASGGTMVESTTTVTNAENHTLYAHWTAIDYTITYDYSETGGSGTESSTVHVAESTLSNTPSASKIYYNFGGFETYESSKEKYIKIIDANGALYSSSASTTFVTSGGNWNYADDIDARPIFTGKTNLQISLDKVDGAGGVQGIKLDYNSKYKNSSGTEITTTSGEITVPTKTNFEFDGYYTGENGTGTKIITSAGLLAEGATLTPFDNDEEELVTHTFYAYWKSASANKYNLNLGDDVSCPDYTNFYQLQGSGWYYDQSCATAYKFDTSTPLPSLPSRTGYTFNGFYGLQSGARKNVVRNDGYLISGISGTTTFDSFNLYPDWTPNVYTITLNKDGMSGGHDAIYLKYGDGYYTNSSCAAANKITLASDESKYHLNIPSLSHYDFLGYYVTIGDQEVQIIDKDGYITSSASTTLFSDDASLTAHKEGSLKQFTMNTSSSGGTFEYSTLYFQYASSNVFGDETKQTQLVDSDLIATREGSTFSGWYTTATSSAGVQVVDGSGEVDPNWTWTAGSTLYARFTYNIYTITLNPGDDVLTTGTESIYYQNKGYYLDSECTTRMTTAGANPITTPTKLGYVFDGYYTSTDGTTPDGTMVIKKDGKLDNAYTLSENSTFVAKWKVDAAPFYLRGTYTPISWSDAGATEFEEDTTLNCQKIVGQYLHANDQVKACQSGNYYNLESGWPYCPFDGYVTATGGDENNIKILQDGYYDFYFNSAGRYIVVPSGINATFGTSDRITPTLTSVYFSDTPNEGENTKRLEYEITDHDVVKGETIAYYIGESTTPLTVYADPNSDNNAVTTRGKVAFHNDATDADIFLKLYQQTFEGNSHARVFANGKTALDFISGENLYIEFDSGSTWLADNAKICAYFFNDTTNGWSNMAVEIKNENGGTGVYEITAPGDDAVWTSFILVRMPSNATEGSWDTYWDKTEDISLTSNPDHYRSYLAKKYNDSKTYWDERTKTNKNYLDGVFQNNYNDLDAWDAYRYYFNEECKFCSTSGGSHLDDIKGVWSLLEDQYNAGSSFNREKFTQLVGDSTASGADATRIVSLYDYILTKYGTSISEDPDFAKRFTDDKGNLNLPNSSGYFYSVYNIENQSILTIVIACAASCLAISSALLFIANKKKKH